MSKDYRQDLNFVKVSTELEKSPRTKSVILPIPPHALWYPNLTSDGMSLVPAYTAFEGRAQVVARDIRLICRRAEVPYLSPHKVRHGHTVYGLKRAQGMAQLKAISQNIMHASVVTTDSIYGKLVDDDVRAIIAGL